ncbi:MAG: septal ring lytic transglycosylase RlpA family protein [Nitrosomonadales bacterium]|nr:septal ring lytic transglycosylase RlpA family protein [Nitrosomonadales bacterium]
MSRQIAVLILATLVLSACGSAPQRKAEPAKVSTSPSAGGYLPGDGPSADTGVDLDAIPDAVPRNEPLHRYANRPYIALGKTYTPLTVTGNFKQRGTASWYGKKFHGQRTSSGELYDMYAMTAAHPTLPIPSYARVTNLSNQKSVIVRVNDRGPFLHERAIDVSYTAAHKLGIIGDGSGEVEVESLAASASSPPTVPSEPVQSKPPEISPPAPIAAAPVALTSLETSETSVYLQLGAFKSQQSAESFMERMRDELADLGKQFKMSVKDGLVRVHIGPYGSQGEARASAESMRSTLGFRPMVNLP